MAVDTKLRCSDRTFKTGSCITDVMDTLLTNEDACTILFLGDILSLCTTVSFASQETISVALAVIASSQIVKISTLMHIILTFYSRAQRAVENVKIS